MINNTVSNQYYASQEKPSFLSSTANGIKTGIKSIIPIYNFYMVGDEFCKIESSKENLENAKNGSDKYEEKTNFQKFLKGVGKTLLMCIPSVGTYALGKAKNEKEALKDEIAGEKTQNSGVIKNYFSGLLEKIKLSLPIYNIYYIGKESLEATNVKNDVDKIVLSASNERINASNDNLNNGISAAITEIQNKIDSGIISNEKSPEITALAEELAALNSNPNLSYEQYSEELIGINDKLCNIMQNLEVQ